jgi:kynurenine formamidase
LHFFAEGRPLDEYPLTRLVTSARVVQAPRAAPIGAAALEQALGAHFRREAVILVTGDWRRWNTPAYFEDYAVLAEDGAAWLVERQVGLLAVDCPSVDPVATVDYPIHRILLGGDCLIVENLAYTPDLPDRVTLAALPIRVKHSNGSPARVVAWDEMP